uniref:Protein kinase domain-containing protein n=1 Tax=Cucumis sativus TaxID=3659 RepID=A0A0A0LGG3_CUCSA
MKIPTLFLFGSYLFFLLFFSHFCYSQKTCPRCGSFEVPYPLSTNPNCGDLDYALRCDSHSKKLYFDALNGSSYPILKINASSQRLVILPSPWVAGSCVTQDMLVSEGLWLNQSLPFNITSSNTIFLLNCSPRLLVSPLNCTPSSLCHHYLANSGRVDGERAFQCASVLDPCCTFIPGGMPSAYKIRLHNSGCRAFRSILHLDVEKPPNQWEEGLEIQWATPPEPICRTQSDCTGESDCLPTGGSNNRSRCLCRMSYYWDHNLGTCLRTNKKSLVRLSIKLSVCLVSFFVLAAVIAFITVRKSKTFSKQEKLYKEREEKLNLSHGGRPARMFHLKEMKKATNEFSKDRVLGSGGFGEVYKGELQDGTVVAVKSAKVGNLKSTEQILNEVGILSQGTLGYLDPEYYRNYQLTDKSDVYSFGVVLLELLTSKKAIDFTRDEDGVNLAIYVIQQVQNGACIDAIDKQLISDNPSSKILISLKHFMELALSCLREKKVERPCMKDVLQELEYITQILDNPETIAEEGNP